MNILIIGLGSIAAKHIDALQKISKNCTIYALRSQRSSAKTNNVIDVYSIDELSVQLDFVIISNPTHLHFDTIQNVLQLGCPVFIEKPSLQSLKNATSLIEQVEKEKTITYVACNLRFHPCIQYIKEYIKKNSPVINEINVYCGSYLPDWRPGRDFREIYSANKEQGGGVHLDLIHELDYLYWIFGKPIETNKILRSRSCLAISAIDYANYSLIYNNFVASVILNYYRRDKKRTFEIVFEEDTWVVDILSSTITSSMKGTIFHSSDPLLDTYVKQMEYFLTLVNRQSNSMNTLRDSVEVLKICLENE